jgi:hypothetical protein
MKKLPMAKTKNPKIIIETTIIFDSVIIDSILFFYSILLFYSSILFYYIDDDFNIVYKKYIKNMRIYLCVLQI